MVFRFRGNPPSYVCYLAGVSILAAVACGYRLGAHPCGYSAAGRNMAIPLFENASHEPRIENLFTEAFRERIQILPCLSLGSRHQADTLLKGRILSAESYPVAVNERFLAMEYGMRVVLSVVLERSGDGEVLWRSDRLEDEVRFYASSDALLFEDNREAALMKLSRRMSERVMDQLLLGF